MDKYGNLMEIQSGVEHTEPSAYASPRGRGTQITNGSNNT